MRVCDITASGAASCSEELRKVRPSSPHVFRPHTPPPFNVVDRVTLSPEAREKSRQFRLQADNGIDEGAAPLRLTYEAAPEQREGDDRPALSIPKG